MASSPPRGEEPIAKENGKLIHSRAPFSGGHCPRFADIAQDEVEQLVEQVSALQTQRERLLDIYLNGKISMPDWDKRNTDLQEKLHSLTQEKVKIESKLSTQDVSREKMDDIQTFAMRIAKSLDLARGNFKLKRRIIEMLNVEVALFVDDKGQKYAHASCTFGEEDLSVASRSTSGSRSTTTVRKLADDPTYRYRPDNLRSTGSNQNSFEDTDFRQK